MAKPPRRDAMPIVVPAAEPENGLEDPDSAASIQRQIAELQARLALKQVPHTSPKTSQGSPRIDTSGGAAVEGSVQLRNGHFIGRDSIRIVNQVVKASEDNRDAQLALSSYLHALATDLAGLRLGELDASTDPSRQTPLQLPDIYVPLNIRFSVPEGKTLELALAARDVGEMLLGARGPAPMLRRATALEALAACPRLTLLGAPGSGKSSFGAHVLLALAQAWQGRHRQLDTLGPAWSHGALLPVRVVLRSFAAQHAGSTRKLGAGDLWTFIGKELHEGGWGVAEQAMVFVQRLAREHGALVLFDGLDECGDAASRERVMVAVQAFMLSEARRSRFVLTARPYAFAAGADPSQGVFELADFDAGQIRQFITAWYQALARHGWRTDAVAASHRDGLIAACGRGDLLPLARNPLLLTLMATLHSHRGRLPDDRVQLYEETVELLLQRWNKDVGADGALLGMLSIPGLTLNHLRAVLESLAFQVHEHHVGENGVAEIGEDQIVRALRPLLGGSKDKADQVLEFIERRAGLLLGHGERAGERRYTFPHRTFQEFLAACHLSTRDNFAQECRRLIDAGGGHWRVVLPLAARLAKAERGATAADELIGGIDVAEAGRKGALTTSHWQRALIAGLQLQEIGSGPLGLSERSLAVLGRVRGWLAAGLPLHPTEGGLPAVERAWAGDVLAALGDPRFDARRLHLPDDNRLGFMPIAADPAFVIGTRTAERVRVVQTFQGREVLDHEINDEPVATDAFWISRHLVTVAQFQAFVDASGRLPGNLDALNEPATRPVRWVDWHEARAYCMWLTEQLRLAPALASSDAAQQVRRHDWHATLPRELDWELAARGGLRGQHFSWGNTADPERANQHGSDVLTTSAVGCFAPNNFGLHDMLGNLWEWTGDTLGPYPLAPAAPESPDGGDDLARVVRGGSHMESAFLLRCARREAFAPDLRSYFIGFRVVLRPARVSSR